MRCEEVIAGLAAPDGPDSPALAEHLEHCPRCAARARQDARLQRLWEVTRPEEPAPTTWATVWAQVTQALDAPAAPTLAPSPRLLPTATPRPSPWRRTELAAFGIAQAAVLLIAAWLVTRPDPGRPLSGPKKPDLAATVADVLVRTTKGEEIEIDYGALVMIQSGPEGVTVVSRATDEGSSAVDGNFVMLNAFEAMAE